MAIPENTSQSSQRAGSKLFQPLKIANGKINLEHRIIHAPMTRNRGVPLRPSSTPENPNRIWYPGDLMATYYGQRATKGGLIITEGVPISLEANGMAGVCGIFTPEQVEGWRKVVEAVHQKGGYLYCQLWHAGRATIPQMTGSPAVSASATVWDSPSECYSHIPEGYDAPVRYSDHPPIEMTIPHIKSTIQDYCKAARAAMEIGFDGVEIVAHNGYLPEQFLSTNINKRTDEYGGTTEKRCAFVLELMNELAITIGQESLAIRLTPFGLFNQARSEQRVETWTFLCQMLKQQHPNLSYVSFIEPIHEQYFSNAEKMEFLRAWGLEDVTLEGFRAIFGQTPFLSAGGWNDRNSWDAIESGKYDGLLFARLFASNPDLVHRLRNGLPLAQFKQQRFFGPFDDNVAGYIDYPPYME